MCKRNIVGQMKPIWIIGMSGRSIHKPNGLFLGFFEEHDTGTDGSAAIDLIIYKYL